MPYCSQCGNQAAPDDLHCARCGARQPVNFGFNINVNNGSGQGFNNTAVTIPAGKRLVIETIGFQGQVATGEVGFRKRRFINQQRLSQRVPRPCLHTEKLLFWLTKYVSKAHASTASRITQSGRASQAARIRCGVRKVGRKDIDTWV